jgi:hypothetical protein
MRKDTVESIWNAVSCQGVKSVLMLILTYGQAPLQLQERERRGRLLQGVATFLGNIFALYADWVTILRCQVFVFVELSGLVKRNDA